MIADTEMPQTEAIWLTDAAGLPAIPSDRLPRRGWYVPIKAVSEYATALIMLLLTAPVVAIAALLVKLTSHGPAFYTQTRLGKDGRPFTIFKLRTMTHECEKQSGPLWSSGRDPRVTWIGRLLRRSHVDELPQLWNVLRGDMVLIGPRPERPEFVTQLEQALPGYRDRMLLYPGVTGLAQVQLPPDADLAGVRRKLAYDLYYIRQVNPWMDFRILVSTALHMVGIPYRWLTVLFMLPGREVVEHTVSARPVPAPLALPQMQAV